MRVYASLFGVITVMICSQYVLGQNVNKGYSFNIGLNFATPTFIYINNESYDKSILAYQFAFNKDFFSDEKLGLTVSLGFNKNSFNAERQIGSIYSIKQIDLSYLSFETGPSYKLSSDNLAFLGSVNLRISRIISENYSDYYTVPSLSSSDIGLNFKIGTELISKSKRPYLLFNYYYGLVKVAENSVLTGTGQSLNDYIRNQSIGIQLGFHF